MKPVRLTQDAKTDLERAFDYYVSTADELLGERFNTDISHVLARIQEHPEAGSPRIGLKFDLLGLRAWQLKTFAAWAVYYLNDSDAITVIRIIHGSQDIQQDAFGEFLK